MKDNNETPIYFYVLGVIPVIWIALLIAPSISGGLPDVIKDFPKYIPKIEIIKELLQDCI